MHPLTQKLSWDIFCRVIDNFGDIGVCWRLAAALAARGQSVRLWVDDVSALAWMAPEGCAGVQQMIWQPDKPMPQETQPGDVVIEAFGCELDHAWIAMNLVADYADNIRGNSQKALKKLIWINLEYLSAEPYVARSHSLRSPVMKGAAQGMDKWFFYPGFTAGTGGLIHEPLPLPSQPQPQPQPSPQMPKSQQPETSQPHRDANAPRRISLFCYEPAALAEMLQQCADSAQRSQLLVMPGRGKQALELALQRINDDSPLWNKHSMLSIDEQSSLPQTQYDALLKSCDLNFVRGEDSLVRAIWAGRAFVWQIYPQADGAHAAKLLAFLDWLQAPPDLREFHLVWNGLSPAALPQIDVRRWTTCTLSARERLLERPDLVTQLLDFVEEKRNLAV